MPTDLLPQQRPVPARETQRPTILLIDDDDTLTEALSYRLTGQGYQTLITRSGRRGLQMARSERPDLVLLDLRLPDIEGLVVCRDLADDPVTCHIPIIILSGMERPDIIRCSRHAGCTYYIRKPYDPNALLVLIRQAMAEAS
jgi:CheY-like chemotaxis protein